MAAGRHRRGRHRRRRRPSWARLLGAAALLAAAATTIAAALAAQPATSTTRPPVAAPAPPAVATTSPPAAPTVSATTSTTPAPTTSSRPRSDSATTRTRRTLAPTTASTARPAPPPTAVPDPPPATAGCESGRWGGVRPHVARAGLLVLARWGPLRVIGLAARPGNPTSDHPRGLALDFMVRGSRGDEIAEWVLQRREQLDVTYVIWEQRINTGSGWRAMADRGGDTANHFDHVHVSFGPTPGEPC